MSDYCEDCGLRTNQGVCSNCQEELYICEFQGEYMDSCSSEFAQKADEQRDELDRRVS
jgi:hypothetical protein